MKVLVLNPNTSSEMTASIDRVARQYARPGTEITSWNPDRGPLSIEGAFDRQIAVESSLEKVLKAKERFDSYIIACFGDPGLQAFREALDANVLGIAESAMLTACILGHKFSVLSVLARSRPSAESLVRNYGLQDRCASVRTTDTPLNSSLVRYAQQACSLLGLPAEPVGYAQASDGRFFAEKGIPTILIGPGKASQAHTVNESIEIDQVIEASRLYALLAFLILNPQEK